MQGKIQIAQLKIGHHSVLVEYFKTALGNDLILISAEKLLFGTY